MKDMQDDVGKLVEVGDRVSLHSRNPQDRPFNIFGKVVALETVGNGGYPLAIIWVEGTTFEEGKIKKRWGRNLRKAKRSANEG